MFGLSERLNTKMILQTIVDLIHISKNESACAGCIGLVSFCSFFKLNMDNFVRQRKTKKISQHININKSNWVKYSFTIHWYIVPMYTKNISLIQYARLIYLVSATHTDTNAHYIV